MVEEPQAWDGRTGPVISPFDSAYLLMCGKWSAGCRPCQLRTGHQRQENGIRAPRPKAYPIGATRHSFIRRHSSRSPGLPQARAAARGPIHYCIVAPGKVSKDVLYLSLKFQPVTAMTENAANQVTAAIGIAAA
jgi:hypothetical protein